MAFKIRTLCHPLQCVNFLLLVIWVRVAVWAVGHRPWRGLNYGMITQQSVRALSKGYLLLLREQRYSKTLVCKAVHPLQYPRGLYLLKS